MCGYHDETNDRRQNSAEREENREGGDEVLFAVRHVLKKQSAISGHGPLYVDEQLTTKVYIK